jgi:hypothetical protein
MTYVHKSIRPEGARAKYLMSRHPSREAAGQRPERSAFCRGMPFVGNQPATIMRYLVILLLVSLTSGCATLTQDSMAPIAMSFSDGSNGQANLQNKRGTWSTRLPSTILVRKSDDPLRYDAETSNGRKAVGMIPSTMGAEIVASAVFLDFGIVDAITDKHRKYPASYVIPIEKVEPPTLAAAVPTQ